MNPTSAAPDAPEGDLVEIRVPADPSYVSTVRLAAAGLAARCDLTVDDIEDLRLAVDEACSLVLPYAAASATLDVRFELVPGCLTVQAGVATTSSAAVNRTGFAWTVLQALTSSVEVTDGSGRVTVLLTKRREVATQ